MTNDYGNLELHTVLLSAMKDIDKICRENGLKYYLHAGTLLGAINHHGFIPWDDDVDISMFRNDYEKFTTIVQKEYSDIYFIQNYLTDENYENNRTVLRVLGTQIIYNHMIDRPAHDEIGIDIVPLDAAPDKKYQRFFQKNLIRLYDIAVQIKFGSITPSSPITKCISILSHKSRLSLGKAIDTFSTRYNHKNTKDVGLLTYNWKSPYNNKDGYIDNIISRTYYQNPTYVEFESCQFMTIQNPEEDLLRRYGPHWAEPYPEEKRVTKHDVKSYIISDEVRKRVGL